MNKLHILIHLYFHYLECHEVRTGNVLGEGGGGLAGALAEQLLPVKNLGSAPEQAFQEALPRRLR